MAGVEQNSQNIKIPNCKLKIPANLSWMINDQNFKVFKRHVECTSCNKKLSNNQVLKDHLIEHSFENGRVQFTKGKRRKAPAGHCTEKEICIPPDLIWMVECCGVERQKKEESKFVCNFCEKSNLFGKNLILHMQAHVNDDPVQSIKEQFTQFTKNEKEKDYLVCHEMKIPSEMMWMIPTFEIVFTSNNKYCKSCDLKLSKKTVVNHLRYHFQKEMNSKLAKKALDSLPFNLKWMVMVGAVKIKAGMVQCNFCNTFMKAGYITEHLQKHSKQNWVMDHYINASYPKSVLQMNECCVRIPPEMSWMMNIYSINVTSDKFLKCNDCNVKMVTNDSVITHLETHFNQQFLRKSLMRQIENLPDEVKWMGNTHGVIVLQNQAFCNFCKQVIAGHIEFHLRNHLQDDWVIFHQRHVATVDSRLHKNFQHWQFEMPAGLKWMIKPHRLSVKKSYLYCNICNVMMPSEKAVQDHLVTHLCRKWVCRYRAKTFRTELWKIKQRKWIVTPNIFELHQNMFYCNFCQDCLKLNEELEEHLKGHQGDPLFETLQQSIISTWGWLRRHRNEDWNVNPDFRWMISAHELQKFEKILYCELCTKVMATQSDIKYHLTKHLSQKWIKNRYLPHESLKKFCNSCADLKWMIDTEAVEISDNSFFCHFCRKQTNLSDIEVHLRNHMKDDWVLKHFNDRVSYTQNNIAEKQNELIMKDLPFIIPRKLIWMIKAHDITIFRHKMYCKYCKQSLRFTGSATKHLKTHFSERWTTFYLKEQHKMPNKIFPVSSDIEWMIETDGRLEVKHNHSVFCNFCRTVCDDEKEKVESHLRAHLNDYWVINHYKNIVESRELLTQNQIKSKLQVPTGLLWMIRAHDITVFHNKLYCNVCNTNMKTNHAVKEHLWKHLGKNFMSAFLRNTTIQTLNVSTEIQWMIKTEAIEMIDSKISRCNFCNENMDLEDIENHLKQHLNDEWIAQHYENIKNCNIADTQNQLSGCQLKVPFGLLWMIPTFKIEVFKSMLYCTNCDIILCTDSEVELHFKGHLKEKLGRSKIGDKTIDKELRIPNRFEWMIKAHGLKIFPACIYCSFCNKIMTNESSIRGHLEKHLSLKWRLRFSKIKDVSHPKGMAPAVENSNRSNSADKFLKSTTPGNIKSKKPLENKLNAKLSKASKSLWRKNEMYTKESKKISCNVCFKKMPSFKKFRRHISSHSRNSWRQLSYSTTRGIKNCKKKNSYKQRPFRKGQDSYDLRGVICITGSVQVYP